MIRVIMEWRARPESRAELGTLLAELASKTTQQNGCVFSETMESLDDPSVQLLLSTWVDPDLWRGWSAGTEHRQLVSRIEHLLASPQRESAYGFVWEACWWPAETGQYCILPAE